jgi:hypothetical protein
MNRQGHLLVHDFELIARIDEYLEELQVSELDREILAEKIEKIQKAIDVFELASYSNLQIWVDELDKRIADILTDRLEKRIQQWVCDSFIKFIDPNLQIRVAR